MFCEYCGSEIPAGAAACPSCGASLQQAPQQQSYQAQPPYQTPQPGYDPASQAAEDSGSIGWGVLSFIIPIVGIVLFFTWKNTKPKSARVAIIGTAISVVFNIVMQVITNL